MLEFGKLLEKGTGEIEISPIGGCIPAVSPPAFVAINFIRLVGSVNGDGAFSTKIAISAVQIALITPSITPKLSTLRTPSRWRNFYFFIEIKIFPFDCEIFFAILTYSVFGFIFHNFHSNILTNFGITYIRHG